jgi:rubrerythrin
MISRPRLEPDKVRSDVSCNVTVASERAPNREKIMKALKKFTSVDEILDFCIEQEEASFKLYSALADLMDRSEMTRLFQKLAEVEVRHKQKFQDLKESKTQLCVGSNVPEIEVREDLPAMGPEPHMACQQAIGLAIKKEVIAAILYTKLAEIVEDENVRNILWAIADEERQHKHYFDTEYDKCVGT